MTGLEAAEEEEAEKRRQRRVAAVYEQSQTAQDEHKDGEIKRTAAIAEHWSQSQSQLTALEESSSSFCSNSKDSDSDSDSNSDNTKDNTKDNFLDQGGGLRQSGRVRRPTRAVQSQMSQDAAKQQEKERIRQQKSKGVTDSVNSGPVMRQ
jgi:hypothetical protein